MKYLLLTKSDSIISVTEANSLEEATNIFRSRKQLTEELFHKLFNVKKDV